MNGVFSGLATRSAHRLAVDRHHALRNADQRGDPAHEAALEVLRVEGGEDVAEVVVRWRTIEEWPEASEKLQFHAAKPGDIDEGFGPGQHREQRQQEHLIERIHDLAALPRIRHIPEMIEEYDRLAKCPAVCRHVFHGCSPQSESRGSS